MIRSGPGSLDVHELDDVRLGEHITALRRECRLLAALLARHTGAMNTRRCAEVQLFVAGHQKRLELLRGRLAEAEHEAEGRRSARLAALPSPARSRPSPDW